MHFYFHQAKQLKRLHRWTGPSIRNRTRHLHCITPYETTSWSPGLSYSNKGTNVTCAFLWTQWYHLDQIIDTGRDSNSTPEAAAFSRWVWQILFPSFHVGMLFWWSQQGGSDKVVVGWLHQSPSTCSVRPHNRCTKRSMGKKKKKKKHLKERVGERRAWCFVWLWLVGRKMNFRKATTQQGFATFACV